MYRKCYWCDYLYVMAVETDPGRISFICLTNVSKKGSIQGKGNNTDF